MHSNRVEEAFQPIRRGFCNVSRSFVAADISLLAGWAASFSNRMFRLQFVSWAFFGSLGTLAAVLTVASVVLAVARRMTFDRGLKDFLEFDMVEEEKGTGVVISSTSLPTFSSAFPTTLPPVSRLESIALTSASNVSRAGR